MPKPPKRPRDMMQLAKFIGETAASEQQGDKDPEPKAETATAKQRKARPAKPPKEKKR